MVDTPEKLWLSAADIDNDHLVWFDPDEGGTEYVRADLYATLEAEVSRLIALPFGLLSAPRKSFPILSSGGVKIDYQLVADHGEQAKKNHYQTVDRLAARGGLSWCELHAVLHNRPWQKIDENEAMIACRALEGRYLSALEATPPAPKVTDEMVEDAARALARNDNPKHENWWPSYESRARAALTAALSGEASKAREAGV